MNIALMAHDRKKELMVQFCIAYCGILAEHSLCATHVTGKLVSEATGLPITLYLHADQGGAQQIGARISFNEIDLVLFFCDPANPKGFDDINKIERLCDQYQIPFATNAATAEVLVQGSAPGRSGLAQHRQSSEALILNPIRALCPIPAAFLQEATGAAMLRQCFAFFSPCTIDKRDILVYL